MVLPAIFCCIDHAFALEKNTATDYERYSPKYMDSKEPLGVIRDRDHQIEKTATRNLRLQSIPFPITMSYGSLPLQQLDIYRLPGKESKPVIFFIHHGMGDKKDVAYVFPAWLSMGYIVVSINHRVVPVNSFPAMVEDANTALKWVMDIFRIMAKIINESLLRMPKKKDTAFEAFRALAVTMVLVGHFAALSKDLPFMAKNMLYSFNSYGLAIFFIISGFLLSASFMSLLKKQDRIYFTVKSFFIKRILRIYPAYILSLIVFSAILTNFFKYPVYWFDLFVHFFNIHNLFEGFSRSINGVYWTLAVEFQWYLFAPLLILVLIKTNIKMVIALFSASIFLSVFMRFNFIHEYFSSRITQTEMIRLGCDQLYIHLFNFIIGIIMYRCRGQKIKLPPFIVGILLLSAISIGYFRTYLSLIYHNEEMFRYIALLDYTGILILGLLLFVFKNIELNGKFYHIISFISLISYSLYIYHFPILHYVVNYNFAWYVTFPLFFAVSVFIAGISYYIIEAPFLKYSSKLGKGSRQPAISS